jgi:hypothetical protein
MQRLPAICPVCKISLPNTSDYRLHYAAIHNVTTAAPEKCPCPHCIPLLHLTNKVYDRASLLRHYKKGHFQPDVVLSYCYDCKVDVQNSKLKAHLLLHAKTNKYFTCPYNSDHIVQVQSVSNFYTLYNEHYKHFHSLQKIPVRPNFDISLDNFENEDFDDLQPNVPHTLSFQERFNNIWLKLEFIELIPGINN